MSRQREIVFNSPLESGLRSLAILVESYPRAYDLQQLAAFDHLVVHTGDVDGPDSLHPRLPLRSTELLVRRGLVERGLLLMVGRGLVVRIADATGITYQAEDGAEVALNAMSSGYVGALRDRSDWVAKNYGDMTYEDLRGLIVRFFGEWTADFRAVREDAEAQL